MNDAYKLMTKAKNRDFWLLGRYFQSAIASVNSNAEYPEQPFELFGSSEEKDDPMKKAAMDAERFRAWAIQANKEFENREGHS